VGWGRPWARTDLALVACVADPSRARACTGEGSRAGSMYEEVEIEEGALGKLQAGVAVKPEPEPGPGPEPYP
jgi:hypothetical protein